jgi:hypothetical protein
MQYIIYLIILIVTSIFMLLYGGHNFRKKTTYNGDYFLIFNRINYLSEEIKKKTLHIENEYKNKNYILNMSKNISCDSVIPNSSGLYVINIKPKGIINMIKLMEEKELNKDIYLMIIFDYLENNNDFNKNNFLNLIVEDDYESIIDESTVNKSENKYGLFHTLDKKINITDIYNIYNPTKHDILFGLFLIKKPFWSY